MSDPSSRPVTAFRDQRILAAGPLRDVAVAVQAAANGPGTLLVFDDASGAVVDLDLRGSPAEVVARLVTPEPRGRGRPALGVVAREVTLLPRHWEWLASHSGGVSAVLRRLVEAARRADGAGAEQRRAQAAASRFMTAMAGDLPGFEAAARALFAGDRVRFAAEIAGWPEDLRAHAERLAFGGVAAATGVAEHLAPSEAAGREFAARGVRGPVSMLNLLRFRAVADYAANPELTPPGPISGEAAFERYVAHTLPFLRASGGGVSWLAAGGPWLIGPEGERWDRAMLVRQASAQAFLAFAGDAAYLAGLGHRTAALEDSRLLPLEELAVPA